MASDGTVHDGTGVNKLVEAVNPDLNKKLTASLATTMDKLGKIQAPFDLEISGGNVEGNARVQAGIDALDAQAVDIQKVEDALAIKINTRG